MPHLRTRPARDAAPNGIDPGEPPSTPVRFAGIVTDSGRAAYSPNRAFSAERSIFEGPEVGISSTNASSFGIA